MKKIILFFGKYWRGICVALLAAVFFVAACSFISYTQRDNFVKWASPDETANFVFSKLYAQTGQLTIYEKFNPFVDEIMQPRSFRSDNGTLKPVSFLGIILIFGTIGKFISIKFIPYLTPFFAAVAIFFYYLLIKKVFTPRIAFLSAILLAAFPVYYYYSVRSMFHNVLFVSFLIIGLYFAIAAIANAPKKIGFLAWQFWRMDWLNLSLAALAGLFLGGALVVRTSEAIWLLPSLFVIWLFNIRKTGILKLIIIVCFAVLPFVPVLVWNQILYGGYFNGGYSEMNKSIITLADAGVGLSKTVTAGAIPAAVDNLKKIKDTIFFFGFKPVLAEQTFKNYFIKMFPLVFWPAALGLVLFFFRVWKWKKRYWAYIVSYFAASAILVLYYGSWDFHDNPNINEITIGNSYTRYWLPIYLGALPFAAFFITRFSWAIFGSDQEGEGKAASGNYEFWNFFRPRMPSKKFFINCVQSLIIIIFAFASFNFLWFKSKEGLAYTDVNNQILKSEYAQVLKLTEPSSVIITRYHDKLFFPERKVVVGLLTDDGLNSRYKKLAGFLPVYYYNFTFPANDFQYLNDSKLKQAGLVLKKIKTTDDVFTLYKLENRPPEIPSTTIKFIKKSLTNLKKNVKK